MNTTLSRREFLQGTAALGAASLLAAPGLAAPPALTIIDTHVHFYDPTRPGGVPWPPKDDKVLYRPALPKDYQALPKPQPVTGVVVAEASPLVEDNQWILDLAAKEKLIVGFVGNLPVGTDEFAAHLKRFATNPLFRGLRVRPAPKRERWDDPRFLADLRLLAERDLSLDLVGGGDILDLIPKLTSAIPSLRIVIDHLASVRIDGQAPDPTWHQAMRAAAKHPNVFAKVSGLVEGSGRRGGEAPRDTQFYQPTLDAMWEMFGEDRLIYGSNWTVCELFSDLATVQRIVTEYFTAKGTSALGKVFSKNAQRAYKWVQR